MAEIIVPFPNSLASTHGLDRNPAAVYLARLASTGRRTQKQALDTMARLLSQDSADCFTFPWQELRYPITAALRTKLAARFKASTVNKYLSALRSVLKEAWRLGLMTAEDCQRAGDVQNVTGSTLPTGRELQPGEIAALLGSCEADLTPAGARDAAVIAVMIAGGLRREEVVNLVLESYEANTGCLKVLGKGNKERTTYLAGGAMEAMTDWLSIRGPAAGPLFWPIDKAGHLHCRRMTSHAVYKLLKKRGNLARVRSFTPHDCRRSFVSGLLEANIDIVTVARLVGHAQVQTTARYDRRSEETKQRAVGALHIPYRRRNLIDGR